MERHQTGQEEKLVEVKLEMDSRDAVHLPKDPPPNCHACFKVVALAAVMGLVIATVLLCLFFFVFVEPPPRSDGAKVNMTCTLKKRDEHGAYDIFTVDKVAKYLIFGWVRLSGDNAEEFTLRQTWNGHNADIKKKTGKCTVFFFEEALLGSNVSVSIHFTSAFTDSLFHIYELCSN